jgi:ureidoacrylate peracid hydrolase
MAHRPDLSDAGPEGSPHRIKHMAFRPGERVPTPDGGEGAILVDGTWNTDIVAELAPAPGDVVVSKHRFSGFFETDLDLVLRTLEVTNLIVVGWTTSICVESTVRDAMFRDFVCVTLADCTAEPVGREHARSNHEASLTMLGLFGWVSSSSELEAALG